MASRCSAIRPPSTAKARARNGEALDRWDSDSYLLLLLAMAKPLELLRRLIERTSRPSCYPRQQEWNYDQPRTMVPSTIDLNGDQHILGHIDCAALEAHSILLLLARFSSG